MTAPGGIADPVNRSGEERIRALYARYSAGLQRHLVNLVGSADAEDLLHDVFERAHRALPRHRGEAHLSTWLYRIATHAALDRLRAQAVRQRDETAMAVRDAAVRIGAAPDAELDRAGTRACIRGLVEALPRSQRAALDLAELRGLTDQETADALGISLGAAKIRLHRARAALRALVACECRTYRDDEVGLTCEPVRAQARASGALKRILFAGSPVQ